MFDLVALITQGLIALSLNDCSETWLLTRSDFDKRMCHKNVTMWRSMSQKCHDVE